MSLRCTDKRTAAKGLTFFCIIRIASMGMGLVATPDDSDASENAFNDATRDQIMFHQLKTDESLMKT